MAMIGYEYFIKSNFFERKIDLKKNKNISFNKITIAITNKFLLRIAISRKKRKKG